MNNTLLLFDVDGTLTKPRLTIEDDMINMLKKVKSLDNIDIGIVGGSNLKKQYEQLGEPVIKMFDWVFSENGLVGYKQDQKISETSIKDYLGEDNLKLVINKVLSYFSTLDIPVKRGTFIEFRTGMINISPIGRNCSQKEREDFYKLDQEKGIRKNIVNYLSEELKSLNLSFSIGGQISIDIFPKGWDKTYCLQFLKQYKNIHFFGDKTYKGGNDYEIYNDNRTIGYNVTNPQDTINILKTY